MRKELVWKTGWLTDEEYNRIWTLSKLNVGIQQIGQMILYGQRLGGRKGIALAVAGFMVPSVVVTVLMTMALVAVVHNPLVEHALRLIVPLTGGMTMAIALQMWNPSLPLIPRDWLRVSAQLALVVICAVLVGVVHVPVPVVMIAALALGALLPV
jgi:chromate transport protein ChrA